VRHARGDGPLRIAFVMSSFEPGGTERQMIELLRRLDRRRWEVHLASLRSSGAWFGRAAEAAASVAVFPVTSFKDLRTCSQLLRFSRWCRDRDIAVVHTAQLPSNIFGLIGAALGGVPVRIGNRRNINPDHSPAEIAAQRVAYACAHKIVANSPAAAERLAREHVSRSTIAVVPNGIEINRAVRAAGRRAPRRVVMVANLRRVKGHDVLIEAAAQVLARVPDATFDIVGGGPLLDSLREMTRQRGVARAFTFFGHQDDVAGRLAEADIFTLPSRSEAMPNALLEAMAAGLPVVASAVGGIRQIVADGRTGLLVPPDDPAALASRLLELMQETALAAALGAAARVEVAARYSFEAMVAAFEAVYVAELRQRCPALAELAAPMAPSRVV
jgi:L-malate glycosyltransferase